MCRGLEKFGMELQFSKNEDKKSKNIKHDTMMIPSLTLSTVLFAFSIGVHKSLYFFEKSLNPLEK